MLNEILFHKVHGAVLCKSLTSTVATVLVLDQETLQPIPTGKLNIHGNPRYEVRVTKCTNLSNRLPYTLADRSLRDKLSAKFDYNCGTGEHTEQFYRTYKDTDGTEVRIYVDMDWKARTAVVTPHGRRAFVFLATFLNENFDSFLTALQEILQDGIDDGTD